MSATSDQTPPAAFGGLLTTSLDPAFFAPDLPIVDSRAWPHLPFLFALVAAQKPRRALYLGVGDGVGYLALCAAAARFAAPETFVGLGPFDAEEALKALSAFHDRRFSGFSRLATAETVGGCDGPFDLILLDRADAELFADWRSRLAPDGALVLLGAQAEHGRLVAECDPARLFCCFDGQGLALTGPAAAVSALCALAEPQATLLRQRLGALGALWAERAIALSLARQFQNDLPRIRETRNSLLRRFGNSFRKSWRDPARHFRKAKAKS